MEHSYEDAYMGELGCMKGVFFQKFPMDGLRNYTFMTVPTSCVNNLVRKNQETLNKHFMQLLAPKRLLRALNRNDDDDDNDDILLFVIFFTSSNRILGHTLILIMTTLPCHSGENNFSSSYGVVT